MIFFMDAGGSTPGNIPLSGVLPLLIAFILFILFGAYFAGAESAFSAVNKIRINPKRTRATGAPRACCMC